MPPRMPAPLPQRTPIADLPPGEGRQLPHNGYIAAEIEAARARGYTPVDIRWEKGQQRVDLIGQGLIIGSVVFNEAQMTAYEAEVRLYKETRPVEKPPIALTESVKDRLAEIGKTGKLATKLQHAPEPTTDVRPDPVKRALKPRGQAEETIAADIRKLMEES
jgi:hypothetical protein